MNINIVEMESKYTGEALVIYMDLLGFSKAVNETWPNTIKTLELIIEALISDDAGCIASVNDDYTIFKQKAIAISDSIFVFQKIENENPINSIVTIDHLITICYLTWRLCIDKGFTVRGGIAYGDIHWNEKLNHLQGPAIVSVAKLEQQANCSRILCSEQFIKFYAELHKQFGTISKKIIPLSNLLINFDGKIALNPQLLCEATTNNSPPRENIKFVLKDLRKLMKDQDEYIQSKYQPLIDVISGNLGENIPTIEDLLTYRI
jgi:hypothetical protein